MPTQRYKLVIAYRGSRFHGWQQQPAMENWVGDEPPPGEGIPTIQGELRRALTQVLRHPVIVTGSSRTDAGVHAKGQVAHIDTDQVQIPREGLRRAVNSRLPGDIVIRQMKPVPDTFHAVRSTTTKRYQYFIWNHAERPVFFPDLAWHRWQKLNVRAMTEAAAHFVGTHDFTSFARPGHGRASTVRTVFGCDVSRKDHRIVVGIEGSGFLWNMVRIMVGTLVQVGLGQFVPDHIPQMLAAKDRQAAGSTAPALGLYLQWIRFAETPVEGSATEAGGQAEVPNAPAPAVMDDARTMDATE